MPASALALTRQTWLHSQSPAPLSFSVPRLKMPTARLFSLFGASVFRNRYHATTNLSLIPSVRLTKLSLSPAFEFHRYSKYSSAAVVDTAAVDTAVSPHHPWPEWVSFVSCLKAKDYLNAPVPAKDEGGVSDGGGDDASQDINLLKDACLSFARDRSDVFKSLSRQDIQRVVEKGCPNLLRKTVNSGKRLRAYVRLEEGDACGACNLRGACHKAYLTLKESEEAARTVDIVRILLSYALDSPVDLGGEKPPGRELIEVSARKLLSELVELSGTVRDPEPPKAANIATHQQEQTRGFKDDELSRDVEMKRGDWMCTKCNFMNFARNIQCRKCGEHGPNKVGGNDIEMKKGDWICRECNFMNFARNIQCRKCGEHGPNKVGRNDNEMKKGDWICPQCSFMNFSRNVRCLKCKTQGSKGVSADVEMKKGDWNCAQCGFMNFASNTNCLGCQELRPKRQLNPGEWECPSCSSVFNYRKNMICKKCNVERSKEEVGRQYEEQIWRKPFSI
ncbi:hypothetical protein RJ639_022723 [Escallonia herrerae]|uniref:RanBP2-type domain-containing protein n=1 Tax=Escallonia herrerae TaxID=1293975 RepID=A0AA88V1B6_9ASTE|nr:hypothetical protein RJ639_022723 [Escallonia herrerae]